MNNTAELMYKSYHSNGKKSFYEHAISDIGSVHYISPFITEYYIGLPKQSFEMARHMNYEALVTTIQHCHYCVITLFE